MKNYRPLSNYLPLRFQNQSVIVRFHKKCPNCGYTVEASDMHGELLVVNDTAIIAAVARCQNCADEFPVTCIINNQKQVKRLMVPMVLLRWWLKKNREKYLADVSTGTWHISVTRGKVTVVNSSDSASSPKAIQEYRSNMEGPDIPSFINGNTEKVDSVSEEIVGSLGEIKIHSWIICAGRKYEFNRVFVEGGKISDSEFIFEGKLVYSKVSES